MDNFMDKIAQKLGAQETIRANAAADAAQLQKLEEQMAQYDACMKEMRKLNLKNAENEQKVKELLEESSRQIKEALEKNSVQLQSLADECIEKIKNTQTEVWDEAKEAVLGAKESESDIQKLLEEWKEAMVKDSEKIEELFRQSDDFVHKENVKVYRNVQAVVVEELEKQTQTLMSSQQQIAAKTKAMFIINIVTLIAVLGNLGVLIAHLVGLF